MDKVIQYKEPFGSNSDICTCEFLLKCARQPWNHVVDINLTQLTWFVKAGKRSQDFIKSTYWYTSFGKTKCYHHSYSVVLINCAKQIICLYSVYCCQWYNMLLSTMWEKKISCNKTCRRLKWETYWYVTLAMSMHVLYLQPNAMCSSKNILTLCKEG